MKKGQVALYLVVGLLLFLGVIVFFLYYNQLWIFSRDLENIADYTSKCLEVAVMEGIYFNGLQGGYFLPANNSVKFDYLEVPIYYDRGAFKPISQREMTVNLEDAVEFIFENCIDDFEAYRRRAMKFRWARCWKVKSISPITEFLRS